jgi:hypothetical protein
MRQYKGIVKLPKGYKMSILNSGRNVEVPPRKPVKNPKIT